MDATSYLLGKKAGGGGITPSGTISITENGETNVTNYATANVNVQPDLETKSVTITENTTTTITPASGKDGLSSVAITTNVSASVETINDVNDIIDNFKTKLDNIPSEYQTLTQTPTTIYCPTANARIYCIFKQKDNTYKIAWIVNANSYLGIGVSSYVLGYRFTVSGTASFSNVTARYYSTNSYTTIEDCVNAIKSNQTAYTSSSSDSNYKIADKNSIILSNGYCVDDATKEFIIVQKISSNETIQVIE